MARRNCSSALRNSLRFSASFALGPIALGGVDLRHLRGDAPAPYRSRRPGSREPPGSTRTDRLELLNYLGLAATAFSNHWRALVAYRAL